MATARVFYDVIARDNASRTFRKVGDEAGFAEGRIARFGKALAYAGTAVAGAAVIIGAESVKMATQFQASMTKIQTQAGGSAKDVKVLSSAVLELADKRAQQGPHQLADALFHLKSVGLGNAAAMKALAAASDLAAVGGANLEDTTNALAGAWRSGIKGAQDFGKTAATVNAIIGAGNMRMADFVQSLSSGILPAARTFGVSLTSVGSAMALMTDEGIPADVAATRLRMTLSLLGAPSAKAAAALGSIGLQAGDLAREMRSPAGLVGAVALLKDKLDASGLSAVKQAQVISHAFGGGRSSAAIMTLLNNVTVLERKQQQINTTVSRYGADVAAQRRTAGAEFARLRVIVEATGVRIGLALLPPVTAFASFLVNTAAPAAGRFAHVVAADFGRIIPVAAIKRDWHDLLRFLGLEKPAPAKLVTGDLIHLPPPAKLTTADLLHPLAPAMLPMSVDLLHPLARKNTMTSQLAAAVSGIDWGKIAAQIGEPLGRAIGSSLGWIGQHGAVFVSNLVTALAGLDWVNIGKAVGSHALGFAIGFISSLGQELFSPSFWQHHWWDAIIAVLSVTGLGRIGGALSKVLEHIPFLRVFAPLFKGLEKVTGPVNKGIDKIVGAVWRGLVDGFRAVFPRAAAFLDREFGLITTRIGVAAVRVLGACRSLGEGILTGIERGTSGLVRLIASVIRSLVSPFLPAGRWLVSHGRDLISGLLSGIGSAMRGIGSWINAHVVQPMLTAVRHFFGIKSPSTVMAGIGSHLMTGLFSGIMAHDPLAVVKKVFGSMPAALAHMVEKGLVSIASLPGRALRALGSLGGSALRGIGGLFSKLLGIFGGGGGSVSGNAALGKRMAAAVGWTGSNWSALFNLWQGESGWNNRARNPASGAFGIPQALPPGKMGAAAVAGSAAAQIAWGLGYIRSVYGSPLNAYRMWLSRSPHWYGRGGLITEPVFGIGARTGRSYGFGESGIERVTPGAGSARGGVTINNNFGPGAISQDVDPLLLAQRMSFQITAASLGS